MDEQTMADAGFSANLTLYDPDGIRVQFTLRLPHHATDFGSYVAQQLAELQAAGFSATEPGLQAGEQSEEVSGWVLGRTSRDQPCVWVYGHRGLQFKIDSVWQEAIPLLPFADDVEGAKEWPTGQAPEQDEARRRGFFNEFAARVVMKDHEWKTKKDSDEHIKVIDRWVGHEPPEAESKPSVRDLELLEMYTWDEGQENYIRYLDSDRGLRGKAEQIVRKFLPAWCKLCETEDQVDYVTTAVKALVADGHIREVSKEPLLRMVEEQRQKLDVPV